MFPVIQGNIFRTAMLGPKIYDLALSKIEQTQSLNVFKSKIRKQAPEGCSCSDDKYSFESSTFYNS